MAFHRPLIVLLAVLGLAPGLRASTSLTGTTADQFLQFGVGSRAVAMGEAYTALSDDVEGLSYNPAGLASGHGQLMLTHNQWFEGATSEHLAGLADLGSAGTFGVAVSYLSIPSQLVTQRVANTGDPSVDMGVLGTFQPFDASAAVGYGRRVAKSLDLGVSIKAVEQSINTSSSMDVAVDLGALYRTPLPELALGLGIQNLGPQAAISHDYFQLPLLARFGASYRPKSSGLIFAADAVLPNDNQAALAFGVEYNLKDTLFPRVGYRMDGIFNPWSVGLGVRIKQVEFDLAGLSYGELGQVFRVSLSYDYGASTPTPTSVPAVAPVPAAPIAAKPVLPAFSGRIVPGKPGSFLYWSPQVLAPERVRQWRFSIVDGRGHAVHEQSGAGPVPPALLWRGDTAGSLAVPGVYWAILGIRTMDGGLAYSGYSGIPVSAWDLGPKTLPPRP